jgi:hypothetical protein
LAIAIETYLEQKSGKSLKTIARYERTLNEFLEVISPQSATSMRLLKTFFGPTRNPWRRKTEQ